jgi:hypothetical protein
VGKWVVKGPFKTAQQDLDDGPSWRVFWLAMIVLFICGFVSGCNAMETQLHHIGLW